MNAILPSRLLNANRASKNTSRSVDLVGEACRAEQHKSLDSLEPDSRTTYLRMQEKLAEASQSLRKQKEKLARMVEFLESLGQQLLDLEPIGEAELVYLMIGHLDRQKDVHLGYVNEMLCKFFLHLKVHRVREQNGGSSEIRLVPSVVSEIRSKVLLQKRVDFAKALNQKILEQEQESEKLFKTMGAVLDRKKEWLVPKHRRQWIDLEATVVPETKQDAARRRAKRGEFKMEECSELFSPEKCRENGAENVADDNNTDKLAKLQNAIDGKKQMFKLCAYLVFYTNLECKETLTEPILKGNENRRLTAGELEMPIQCEFCKLVNIKTFKEFYYRFDLIQRFGKLCKFTTKGQLFLFIYSYPGGTTIWVHEMCLLWSNRVNVDQKFNTVDIESLIPAVEEAGQQICRYCSTEGASLKCNKPECQVHLHFYCIKQLKLRGIQFDVKERFRFFCEDHHRKLNTSGHSEWFLTRYRLKQLVAKNGLGEEKKRDGCEEKGEEESVWEDAEQSEPRVRKAGKRE